MIFSAPELFHSITAELTGNWLLESIFVELSYVLLKIVIRVLFLSTCGADTLACLFLLNHLVGNIVNISHVGKHGLLGSKGFVAFLTLNIQSSVTWLVISPHVALQFILGEKCNVTLAALQSACLSFMLLFHVLLKSFSAVECVCTHFTLVGWRMKVVYKHMVNHLKIKQYSLIQGVFLTGIPNKCLPARKFCPLKLLTQYTI